MTAAAGGAERTATGTLALTITPNPSLDLLFDAEQLVWDDANRMRDPRRRAGGQGINVTRAARLLGGGSTAVAMLGGRTGAELEAMLAAEGTPLVSVWSDSGDTRTFVAVRESATGRSMLLNARGPQRTDADAERLEAAAIAAIRELTPRWVACCGSLPTGLEPDLYARIVAAARAAGARTVVDCDGEPLRRGFEAGCDLLVPNQHEAARLTGREIHELEDAVTAARWLRDAGVPTVAVTLGAAGAVLATSEGCWQAVPPRLASGSAVGAGDAFLAALLVALEDPSCDPARALGRAVGAGSAVLRSAGGALLEHADAHDLAGRTSVRPAG